MNLQLPCIWSDTVSFYSSAFSLTKFSSLCLLYTACSARQSLPVSVYQSWAVPSKFLIKTTSSSVCYSSTLLHSVSWWIHQNQNLLQGFSRQSLLFFFLLWVRALFRAVADTLPVLCRLVPLWFLCQHLFLKRTTWNTKPYKLSEIPVHLVV